MFCDRNVALDFKTVLDTSENLPKSGPKRFYSIYLGKNSTNLLEIENTVFLHEIERKCTTCVVFAPRGRYPAIDKGIAKFHMN